MALREKSHLTLITSIAWKIDQYLKLMRITCVIKIPLCFWRTSYLTLFVVTQNQETDVSEFSFMLYLNLLLLNKVCDILYYSFSYFNYCSNVKANYILELVLSQDLRRETTKIAVSNNFDPNYININIMPLTYIAKYCWLSNVFATSDTQMYDPEWYLQIGSLGIKFF